MAEVKTVVETYILDETECLIYDNEKLDDWNKFVSNLGLTGQENLRQEGKSPMPFMPMNDNITKVFNTLCPVKVDIKKYDKSPIPVEVLSLVQLCINEGYFGQIQIWYDDKEKDPICVGIVNTYYLYHINGTYYRKSFKNKEAAQLEIGFNDDTPGVNSWNIQTDLCLIARWGDVKKSLDQLKKAAIARYRTTELARITKEIRDLKRRQEDIEETIIAEFG